MDTPSLPAWECGLKLNCAANLLQATSVTPCVGVWIEMAKQAHHRLDGLVTPCVGVWIEIWMGNRAHANRIVTPCVGVWIEIKWETVL